MDEYGGGNPKPGRVRQDADEHAIHDGEIRKLPREQRREIICQAVIHPDGAHQLALPLGKRLRGCAFPIWATGIGGEGEARRLNSTSLCLFAEKRDPMATLGERAGNAQRWRHIPASIPGGEYKA